MFLAALADLPYLRDENGNIILDEDGLPILADPEITQPILTGEDGVILTDESGKPLTQL